MSVRVSATVLPDEALLARYRANGGHVDCFAVELPGKITLPQLITAFYTSRAFRPERWLIGLILGKRADNGDVASLAEGTTERFSAWSVEARSADQILLRDYQGRTRSWLMVMPLPGGATRLHFGSAVVRSQKRSDRLVFAALLGFHRWYSRALLRGALRQL